MSSPSLRRHSIPAILLIAGSFSLATSCGGGVEAAGVNLVDDSTGGGADGLLQGGGSTNEPDGSATDGSRTAGEEGAGEGGTGGGPHGGGTHDEPRVSRAAGQARGAANSRPDSTGQGTSGQGTSGQGTSAPVGTGQAAVGGGSGANSGQVGTNPGRSGASPATSFLDRMVDAPFDVPFAGERVWTVVDDAGQTPATLVYRETLGADGGGQFAIESEQLSGPGDPQAFELEQLRRQGFNYRQRDFRIRDLDLFLQNYTLQVVDTNVPIAGVECVELAVHRVSTPPGGAAGADYTVHVDPDTGLVLASVERDPAGAVVASMVFETIEYGADLSHLTLTDGLFQRRELNLTQLNGNGIPELGFDALLPSLPPPGYVLRAAFQITSPLDDELWLKLEYTDGLEPLTFLHRASSAASSTSTQPSAGSVDVMSNGNLSAAFGELAGTSFIAAGKASLVDLLSMAESALVVD